MTNDNFQEAIGQLHDARVFGVFFDSDISTFTFDFYIYVQLFGNFEDGSYELKKALLKFAEAKIIFLSIENDLSQGQFFIVNVNCKQDIGGLYRFDFTFSSDDVKLSLLASNFEVLASQEIQYSSDQYLNTDWGNLLNN